MMNDAPELLKLLYDEEEEIYIRKFNDKTKENSQNFNFKLKDYSLWHPILKQYNDNGDGIFFVVNKGGHKDEKITEIKAHFIDLDLRTDNKPKVLDEIKSFKLPPTAIVETFNGYHVYWKIEKGILGLFSTIQKELNKLIKYSDSTICNLSRVLRVPNFYHHKTDKPFLIKEVEINKENTYTQKEFMEGIGLDYTKEIKKMNETEEILLMIEENNLFNNTIKIEGYEELLDFLKRQNLIKFLSLNVSEKESFKCLFHQDKTPSAYIYINRKGYYKYRCFSANCDVSEMNIDIIDIVQRLFNKSFNETIKYLCDLYNIDFSISEFQREQQDKYDLNTRFINREGLIKLRNNMPSVYTYIKPYKIILNEMINFAREKMLSSQYKYNNESLFFVSNRYLRDMINMELEDISDVRLDIADINRYINMLATLGFLNKIHPANLPRSLYLKAKQIAERREYSRKIMFYTMPNFYDIQFIAHERAKVMLENKIELRDISQRNISSLFGDQVATEIYHINKHYSEIEEKTVSKYIGFIKKEIEDKGYTTKEDIIKIPINIKINGKTKRLTKNEKSNILNKIFDDLLERLNLDYVKASKEQMRQFGFDAHIYIIIREED